MRTRSSLLLFFLLEGRSGPHSFPKSILLLCLRSSFFLGGNAIDSSLPSISTSFQLESSGSLQRFFGGLHTKIRTKTKQTQNFPELNLSLKLLPDVLSSVTCIIFIFHSLSNLQLSCFCFLFPLKVYFVRRPVTSIKTFFHTVLSYFDVYFLLLVCSLRSRNLILCPSIQQRA